ncbi:MAG: hypothetical protein NTX31_15570 [Burkholderiales bacterium]|jgi:hypothetical protein|nr:hypothetical protein [Burkholderiales bacterium]
MTRLTPAQQQIPLALPMDPTLQEELMLKKASELYRRSRLLNIRYPSFKHLMEDPIAGRCMRMSATHLLRL